MKLKDLLKDAYKEGITVEEIESALGFFFHVYAAMS